MKCTENWIPIDYAVMLLDNSRVIFDSYESCMVLWIFVISHVDLCNQSCMSDWVDRWVTGQMAVLQFVWQCRTIHANFQPVFFFFFFSHMCNDNRHQ